MVRILHMAHSGGAGTQPDDHIVRDHFERFGPRSETHARNSAPADISRGASTFGLLPPALLPMSVASPAAASSNAI